jgi:3',5'-cyclic AMP phosphodiesterase CpdA
MTLVVVLTVGTARPDRDEGEVGHRQNLWMERTMSKYDTKVKIIAMHHHLIGVPDTGTDKNVILDAGDTLRAYLRSKVNLVLCGHKHRPWVLNPGALEIAYAGTLSSARFRGLFEFSYNVIHIKGAKPNIDIKIVGGKRFSLLDLVEKYKRHA